MPESRAYTRPMPPERLALPGLGFARAEEVEEFAMRHFIDRSGLFYDDEHGHLGAFRIGILWASSVHIDKGSEKAGTAQIIKGGEPRTWSEAVQRVFLHEMFGADLPVFKITLSAPAAARYDDREFFALLDHELLHCAHGKDQYGAPRFNGETGAPVPDLRPHDAETFAGTVERFGAHAGGAASVVLAGMKAPRFGWVPGKDLDIHKACGTR